MRRLPLAPLAPLALLALAGLAACNDGGDPSNPDIAPVITVTGVTDGGVYDPPVTVGVTVDRGTYTATLNGDPLFTAVTVTEPGAYTLEVTARNGSATSEVALSFFVGTPAAGVVYIRVLDLGPIDSGGGGDAILISDSSEIGWRHALIDAGSSFDSQRRVNTQLGTLGVDTLHVAMVTHAHEDHYMGMSGAILSAEETHRFLYNGQVRNIDTWGNMLAQAEYIVGAANFEVVTDSVPILLGSTRLVVLPPLGDSIHIDNNSGSALNNESLGTRLEHGAFDMFLTGDGEARANARWRTVFPQYSGNVTALKVGHHGANDAIFEGSIGGPSPWLDHTDPEIAVISANGITHPRIAALTRLLDRTNTRTYCTNVHGRIEIRVDPLGAYEVTVQKNPDADCVAGSEATT